MELEQLKEAVREAQKTISMDKLAYDYGISPPTLRKVLAGEESVQVRTELALEKIIADYRGRDAVS